MTKQFEARLNITVRDVESARHTMRELVLDSLEMYRALKTISQAADSSAEHWHSIAREMENEQRRKAGTTFKAVGLEGTQMFITGCDKDREAIATARALFDQLVGEEILFLRREKGWEENYLPGPAKQAVERIMGAWELGMSLNVLSTCSQCAKARAAFGKEKDKDRVARAGVSKSDDKSGADVQLTGVPEIDAELERLISAAKEAAAKDSKTVLSMLKANADKMQGVAHRLASALASAAA